MAALNNRISRIVRANCNDLTGKPKAAEGTAYIATGAVTGAGVSATIGGMGLVGSFGGIGIGMAPVAAAGAVVGAAAYGGLNAIADADVTAVGAIGIGALGGAGVSATVGGMGLAGGFGAVGIGMGTMAAAGGVVGLGAYGLYKAFQQEPGQGIADAIDGFERMESKALDREAYTQALLELDSVDAEWLWKQKFAALEAEEELKALKAETLMSIKLSTQQEIANLTKSKNLLRQQLKRAQQEVIAWQKVAIAAIKQERIDLARKALEQKLAEKHNVTIIPTQLEQLTARIESLKSDLLVIEMKLA